MVVIRSDVDKIIATLKKYKYLSLDEISKYSGVKTDVIEQWLPVLEDSGYIKIVYQFTKVYVEWVGEETEEVKQPGNEEVISETEINQNLIPEEELMKHRKVVEIKPEEAVPVEPPKEKTEKKVGKKEETIKPKKKIEPEIMPETETNVEKIKLKPVSKKPFKTVPIQTEEIKQSVEELLAEKQSKVLSPYAQKLKKYLAEIDAAKKELEELKKEKSKLYSEVYEPMEKEFRAGYTTIAERIAEKQKMILELQEKALNLPEKLEEVDRQQIKLHEIGEKVKHIANESTNIINSSLTELEELSNNTSKEVNVAKQAINNSIHNLSEAQTLLKRIESVEDEISTKMMDIEERVKEEQEKLETLAEAWKSIQETKNEIVDKIKKSSEMIEEERNKLKIIEQQLTNIEELKEWIKMSQEAYDEKIKEFDNYIEKNKEDYNTLREAIEANYLKMYMKDLADLSKEYEGALASAKEKEKSIDEKMALAKKKISDLVRQSRELVEAFEKGKISAEDYKKIKKELDLKQKKKTDEIKQLITEREMIAESIEKTRTKKTSKKSKNKKTGKQK